MNNSLLNKSFLIGSDPEVFLRRDGNLIPAFNFISGDKHSPQKTLHGSIQYDNIMAEFNSIPASSLDEFITNHRLILDDLSSHLGNDLTIDITPAVVCDWEVLSDFRAMTMGCEPDYNAWTGRVNPKILGESTNLRVAGGHLHISTGIYEDDSFDEDFRTRLVKALDLVLGVQSVLHDPSDASKLRKQQYGKAGSFRPKIISKNDPYDGVEYRTLSNYWLKSDKFMRDVYLGVEKVINNINELAYIANKNKSLVTKIINNNDYKLAKKFVNNHSDIFDFSDYNTEVVA